MSAPNEPAVAQAIGDVLVRYATGIDQRDWELFRTCFTEDCTSDYGDIGVWSGVEEITDFMEQSHALCGPTLHRITNIVVTPDGAGRAKASSYVDALVMGTDGTSGVRATGSYADELVDTEDGWHIAARRYSMVLVQPVGEGLVG